MQALRVAVSLLSSRKVQVALATFIATLLAAFGLKDYPAEVIVTVIASLAGLGGVLINSIKAEDVAAKTAAGVVAAANVTANTAATTTTVSTPGESNVTVTAPSDTGTVAPPQPIGGTFTGRY
jgi:hypothetical protein